jgi:VanZ family protein
MAEQVNNWLWAVIAWLGVIFFSSTSLASKWAEESFRTLAQLIFGNLNPFSGSYGLFYLLTDKGFHVAMFCVFAVLLWRTLAHAENKVWVILIAGAITGCCSELLQRLFPDRDPAVRDVLINVGGTALGIAACIVASRWKQRRAQEPTAEPDPVLVD